MPFQVPESLYLCRWLMLMPTYTQSNQYTTCYNRDSNYTSRNNRDPSIFISIPRNNTGSNVSSRMQTIHCLVQWTSCRQDQCIMC